MDPSRILKEFLEAPNPNHTGSKYWSITGNETDRDLGQHSSPVSECRAKVRGHSGCYRSCIMESHLVPPPTTRLGLQGELD